jgi:putative chitinase
MLLKKGDNNENVKQLQVKLGLDPVGNFGPRTEEAIKAFQVKHGLTADGIVGDKTWNLIMGVATEAVAPAAPAPAAPVASVGGLKLDKLKGHIPQAVIDMIPDTAAKFGINTPLRLAHFLAQCGHESGGFRVTQENLNYSAKGLNGIFRKYFPTEAAAAAYARQPQKIANKVYGNRMGNGPESSGEGFKFRGRGYIQLTGKENYTAFGKAIGVDIPNNPDLVASTYALLSAAWFFTKNGLHRMADEGASDLVVTKITKRVNGGTIGLPDRIKHFKEYYHLLNS